MSGRLSMNEALRLLRRAGARCELLERGTIVCHRSEAHWSHPARRGTYSLEGVRSALEDCAGPPAGRGRA